MRSPLTGVVFALELTHDVNMVLPLLVAVTIAHGFTVLTLRRSILTEKIARRGYHLSREYAVDPLEILFVREVMRTSVAALPADAPYETLRHSLHGDSSRGRQRLYPVIGENQELIGVVTRGDLQTVADAAPDKSASPLAAILNTRPTVAGGHTCDPDRNRRCISLSPGGLAEAPR
jgi:chloride channel protein, CIC family